MSLVLRKTLAWFMQPSRDSLTMDMCSLIEPLRERHKVTWDQHDVGLISEPGKVYAAIAKDLVEL